MRLFHRDCLIFWVFFFSRVIRPKKNNVSQFVQSFLRWKLVSSIMFLCFLLLLFEQNDTNLASTG